MADDDSNQIQKIDLDKVDWKSSREFFESLGEELDKIDNKDEAYDFKWVGKRKAVIEAGAPINKTLRPNVEESEDWDTTENLFIEGDNLDALKLLQESYLGKVKMIYIDPPYNTGGDFIYHDDFSASVEEYEESTEYKDDQGNIQFKKNDKSNGRYHSDWLSMMYPRLKLARNLMADDGVIFISIDDNEQPNLRKLCDEIFGEDNFIACLTIEISLTQGMKVSAAKNGTIVKNLEYVLAYTKANENWLAKKVLYDQGPLEYDTHFSYYLKTASEGVYEILRIEDLIAEKQDIQSYFQKYNLNANFSNFKDLISTSEEFRQLIYTKYADVIYQSMGAGINIPDEIVKKLDTHDAIQFQKYILHKLSSGNISQLSPLSANVGWTDEYKPTFGRRRIRGDLWKGFYSDMMNVAKEGDTEYKNGKKPVRLIKQLISIATDPEDIVLDFFSGSSTTAHAVMLLNVEDGGTRKHIQVQLPEETDKKTKAYSDGFTTIPQISRDRIRKSGKKIKLEYKNEISKREKPLDVGFRTLTVADTNYKEVFKTVGQHTQESLLDTVDNVKEDRSELDLLYGVLVQSALELNRPIEKKELSGADVYVYDYFGEVSGLVACFADSVPEETIKEIAKLKPLTAVFKDSSFESSQDKVNLAEHFRIISPDTKVKVV